MRFIIQRVFFMLLSVSSIIILPSAVTPSAVPSSTISMITSPSLPEYWTLVIIGLMTILSLRVVLSPSKIENKDLDNSFNLAIIPLVICFAMIVVYKVIKILSDSGL